MSRLDLLPNNAVAAWLRELEDTIRDFKKKQRHSGLSGLRGYFVDSGNTWDKTGTVSNSFREFEIIFTASGKQPFPIENVQVDIRFGGTADANKPRELPNGFWGYDDGVNFASVDNRNPQFDVNYSDNETQYRWTFSFNISGTLPYYLKAYVAGSSDGTVVVNQTYP